MRSLSFLRILGVAAVLATTPAGHAQGAKEISPADLVLHGDGHEVLACSTCHGPSGEGNASAGFPRLAGLPQAYLAAQLDALATGARQSPVMEPIAKSLNTQQRQQLARYYSRLSLPQVPTQATPDDRVAVHGRWDDDIPACVNCHGAKGSGVGERFPPLAGQSSLYIANQLRAWKSGMRHADPLGLMQAVASRLTDPDVQAVSDYFAAQPSVGNAEVATDDSSKPGEANGTHHAGFTPTQHPIPDDDFGKIIKSGRDLFENPARYASQYVGNDLTCTNCHLDAGRHVGSAPLWAAYVSYPAYRAKNHRVNTFEERLQGCFQFSMNGKAPPLGDPVLVALESYAYWMAQGAPLDPNIPGRGYPKPTKPALAPDYTRGSQVYARSCALCHGADGGGQHDNDGSPAFPALWGPHSFNWGAGMGSVNNAAAFIKANMPLGLPGTLSDQDAWDVALFMDSHERPQDPRFTGSVADTRAKFHDGDDWMYGKSVNGHILGSDSAPPGPQP